MSLFLNQTFLSHSGLILNFKIDCDSLTNSDLKTLAEIVSKKFTFHQAFGIPRGGTKFAEILRSYQTYKSDLTLIIDDVFTTGRSFEEFRKPYLTHPHAGVVIFARTSTPSWIHPIFTLNSEFN